MSPRPVALPVENEARGRRLLTLRHVTARHTALRKVDASDDLPADCLADLVHRTIFGTPPPRRRPLVTPEAVERITGLTPEMLAAIGKVELAREESRDDAWWSGYAQGKDEAETRDLNFDELTDQVEDLRAQLAAADRIANERQRLSLDQTLSMLIVDELNAGNDERAASLRSLRAWNRGAGYVIPTRTRGGGPGKPPRMPAAPDPRAGELGPR